VIDLRIGSIVRGTLAGFIATIVLSLLMLVKQALGVMPGLDVIGMLSAAVGASNPFAGWTIHFIIGSVAWGALFAALYPVLPGPFWRRGVDFGIGAWLGMMLFVMPMTGAGAFGLKLGITAPAATLVLHIIYGAVLGVLYGSMARVRSNRHHDTFPAR
jgi:hypothetical protein